MGLLTGRQPRAAAADKDRQITELRHEIKNSIQVVQSGNRLIQNMSGAIALNAPRRREQ